MLCMQNMDDGGAQFAGIAFVSPATIMLNMMIAPEQEEVWRLD